MSQRVTLNIERDSVRILVSRGQTVENWFREAIEPGLVMDGSVADAGKLASTLEQMFRIHRLPRQRVSVSVAGMLSVIRVLAIPKTDRSILQEALHREASREMPVPPDQLHLYWTQIGSQNGESQYLVAGVDRSSEDTIMAALRTAGLRNPIIEIRAVALARASGQNKAVLVECTKEAPLIIIVSRGVPWIVRTAAAIKSEWQTKEIAEVLTSEISRTVQYFNGANPTEPIDSTVPVLLSGELSADAEINRMLEAGLKRVVAIMTPPMSYPPAFPVGDFMVNMGLALSPTRSRGLLGGPQRTSTLSPALAPIRYPGAPPQPSVFWLVASLALLCISLATFFVRQSKDWQVVQLSAQSAAADARLDAGRKANIQLNAAKTNLNNLLAERQSLLQPQGDFSRNLVFVLDRQPAQLKVTAYMQSADKLHIEGDAVDFGAVLQYVRSLEGSPYFSDVYLTSMAGDDGPGTKGVSFAMDIFVKD